MPSICKTNCAVATAFLISMLYKMFSVDKAPVMKEFNKTLNSSLANKYQKIILERRNIYLQGYAVGFAIALFVIISNYYKLSKRNTKNSALPKIATICTATSIVFIVSYLFYIIHPKSDYMIKYLNTQQQRTAWLNVYRHMQLQCHLGFALGVIAVFLYANSVCPDE